MNYQIFVTESMFNVFDATLPNSSLKSELGYNCELLHVFFKDADKSIISVSDTVVCLLNVLSSIIAVFSNLLILFALYRASSLHHPSKALLCSLALSDLGVGIIVQPLFVTYRWAEINGRLSQTCAAGILSHVEGSHFSAVSFLTITAIGVDRLLALTLRIRYHGVVTLKRVFALLSAIWILSAVWASLWVTSQQIYSLVSIFFIPICFLITLFSYVKIYFRLRRQTIQMGSQTKHLTAPNNILNKHRNTPSKIRYKTFVISMFYLFCALVVSFLPYLFHKILVRILGWSSSTSVLFSFGLTLVYMNSSVNPLIYCWRIPEIKEIVTGILRDTKRSVWSSGNTLMPNRNRVRNLPIASRSERHDNEGM